MFIGFGNHTAVDERIATMDSFIKAHFPEMSQMCTNLFPDEFGRPSLDGFVEFASPGQARLINEQICAQSLQLENHKTVKIRAALTDIDRS